MQQQTFEIGAVVALTGEQRGLTVVAVTAERVRCAWFVGDRQFVASYPPGALRLIRKTNAPELPTAQAASHKETNDEIHRTGQTF